MFSRLLPRFVCSPPPSLFLPHMPVVWPPLLTSLYASPFPAFNAFPRLIPSNFWSLRATLRAVWARKFFNSSDTETNSTAFFPVGKGRTVPVACTAARHSAVLLSPALGFLTRPMGKTMSLDLYSFSRCTLACNDSTDRFVRRWSTAMPTDLAYFLVKPASFSSWIEEGGGREQNGKGRC